MRLKEARALPNHLPMKFADETYGVLVTNPDKEHHQFELAFLTPEKHIRYVPIERVWNIGGRLIEADEPPSPPGMMPYDHVIERLFAEDTHVEYFTPEMVRVRFANGEYGMRLVDHIDHGDAFGFGRRDPIGRRVPRLDPGEEVMWDMAHTEPNIIKTGRT